MAAAAARLGLRARVLLRAPAPALLRGPVSTLSTNATAGKPIPTVAAADATAAAKPIPAVAGDEPPSANLIWLDSEVTRISASHTARIHELRRETESMMVELDRAEAKHDAVVAECKLKAMTNAWEICMVGGAFFAFVVFFII